MTGSTNSITQGRRAGGSWSDGSCGRYGISSSVDFRCDLPNPNPLPPSRSPLKGGPVCRTRAGIRSRLTRIRPDSRKTIRSGGSLTDRNAPFFQFTMWMIGNSASMF